MWDVVGHERVVEALNRDLSSERVPHALLFTGPRGVGKTHLAIQLAKALNCEGGSPPCGQCVQCRQTEIRSHPDVVVIERPDGKDSIAIGQVRELRDAASLRPFQARRKVFLIVGAESMTDQAADALLKTLEEPQPQVTILLTAPDADSLPATVLSRCRVMSLGPIPREAILRALTARGTSWEEADELSRLAGGNVGWAIGAATTPKLVQAQRDLIERLARVPNLKADALLDLAEALTSDRKDRSAVRRNLEVLLLLFRDLLLVSHGLPAETAQQAEAALRTAAARYSVSDIAQAFESIQRAMERIDANVDPRLTFEALLLGLR